MLLTLKRLWTEEDGVLAFEWTLLLTLLVIGIVGGVAGARDAIIDELGDTAQVMLAVDQSYTSASRSRPACTRSTPARPAIPRSPTL